MADRLVVRGAREHNLQDVSLDLPRDRLIVFTGLSGSGKSSLAFDTIYAEGQRRYVESLSAYARQFLGQMDKPDVDFIEGSRRPSPSTRSRRHGTRGRRWARSPRSTTTSGCSTPGSASPTAPTAAGRWPGRAPSRSSTASWPWTRAPASWCWPPWSAVARVSTAPCSTTWPSRGSPGPGWTGPWSSWPTAADLDLARYEQHTIEVVVDRLVRRDDIRRRLTESLETALSLAEGVAEIVVVDADGTEEEAITFSQHLACTYCGLSFEDPSPRNFSFNSPYGACPACTGLGTRYEVDPDLVVPDPTKSLAEGALAPWSGARSEYFNRLVAAVAELGGFSLDDPWEKLTKADRKLILYGTGTKQVHLKYRNRYGRQRSFHTLYEGIVPWLRAAPLRGRVRLLAGQPRGLSARGALPRVRRSPAPARVAGRDGRGLLDLRPVLAPHRQGGRRGGVARPLRPGPSHRRPGLPRGPGADAVPARTWGSTT